ncbi:hypothetical protein AVEN_33056-1 [Araneus ventricosus]|uniref:Uncharacterized protein n=1 Tax=Araneus ventricosus TaxID=182803 RepID=A0A4Y2MPJ8_ARAVE|nr:hypothetical protein AVEN_33056-1 [Araneus ventricosus]
MSQINEGLMLRIKNITVLEIYRAIRKARQDIVTYNLEIGRLNCAKTHNRGIERFVNMTAACGVLRCSQRAVWFCWEKEGAARSSYRAELWFHLSPKKLI